jgi:hypothetical protein
VPTGIDVAVRAMGPVTVGMFGVVTATGPWPAAETDPVVGSVVPTGTCAGESSDTRPVSDAPEACDGPAAAWTAVGAATAATNASALSSEARLLRSRGRDLVGLMGYLSADADVVVASRRSEAAGGGAG